MADELSSGAKKSQTEADKTLTAAGLKERTSALQERLTNLRDVGEFNVEEAPVLGVGDIPATAEGARVGAEARLGGLQDLIKQYQTTQKDIQAQQKTTQSWLKRIMGAPKEEPVEAFKTAREEALAEMGLTSADVQKIGGLIGKVSSLNQDIATLGGNRDVDILKTGEMLATTAAVTGAKRRKEILWNTRIAAKQAEAGVAAMELQMIQGAYNDAKSTAWQVVQAQTQAKRQKVADMKWVYDTQQDALNRLDAESRDLFNKLYNEAQKEETRDYNEGMSKLDMMMNAARQGISLGWTSDYMEQHSIEELSTESSQRVAARVREVEAAKAVGVGVTPGVDLSTYFSPDQLRQIARAGIDLATPEGLTKALEMFPVVMESEQWTNAESYIQRNIDEEATSTTDIATIYTTLKKNTKLADSDIKAMMAERGMVYMPGGIPPWVYMPTGLPKIGEVPEVGEEGLYERVGKFPARQVWKGAKWLWGKVK